MLVFQRRGFFRGAECREDVEALLLEVFGQFSAQSALAASCDEGRLFLGGCGHVWRDLDFLRAVDDERGTKYSVGF